MNVENDEDALNDFFDQIDSGDMNEIKRLMKKNPNLTPNTTIDGTPALLHAIRVCENDYCDDIVSFFLEKNTNPFQTDAEKTTPLMEACSRFLPTIIEKILVYYNNGDVRLLAVNNTNENALSMLLSNKFDADADTDTDNLKIQQDLVKKLIEKNNKLIRYDIIDNIIINEQFDILPLIINNIPEFSSKEYLQMLRILFIMSGNISNCSLLII